MNATTPAHPVGVGWAMGGPAFLAQRTDVPRLVAMVDSARATTSAAPAASGASAAEIRIGPIPLQDNPGYGALDNMAIAAFVLVVVLLLVKYARGFFANTPSRTPASRRTSAWWG